VSDVREANPQRISLTLITIQQDNILLT